MPVAKASGGSLRQVKLTCDTLFESDLYTLQQNIIEFDIYDGVTEIKGKASILDLYGVRFLYYLVK